MVGPTTRALLGSCLLLALPLAACQGGGDAATPSPSDAATPSDGATPTNAAAATATPAQPTATATAPAPTPTALPATDPPTATPAPTAAPTPAPFALSPRQRLIRGSLDLRGVRPSEAEYAAVEADPEAVDALVQGFMADPRFEDRVVSLFAPLYRTQLDRFDVQAMDYGLTAPGDEALFAESVGDEALRLLAYITVNDRPYTELVTADYTLATPQLIEAWDLEAEDPAAQGWQVARYPDSRPPAGVLATNAMWWRYPSNGTNYNRGRANALSRILLCNDYAARPVNFDTNLDLTDEALVQSALKTNPGCINCHASLDPLASYLFGFTYAASDAAADATVYHPERERLWQTTTGTAPGYYGSPGYTMTDLSHQIAGDPRFIECAVEQVFEGLLDRPAGLNDIGALTRHREAFLQGGITLKALFRSILSDPRYSNASAGNTGGSLGGDADPTADPGFRLKVVAPDLLASQVADLTGYRFTMGGADMLRLDGAGLRSLAGGADGATGAAPQVSPTATLALVHERVAEAASFYVVARDADPANPDRLFTEVDFSEDIEGDPAALTRQIQALHRRLFGRHITADGPEVEANLGLWEELYRATGDTHAAWAGLLSVLLRDPEFIFY